MLEIADLTDWDRACEINDRWFTKPEWALSKWETHILEFWHPDAVRKSMGAERYNYLKEIAKGGGAAKMVTKNAPQPPGPHSVGNLKEFL